MEQLPTTEKKKNLLSHLFDKIGEVATDIGHTLASPVLGYKPFKEDEKQRILGNAMNAHPSDTLDNALEKYGKNHAIGHIDQWQTIKKDLLDYAASVDQTTLNSFKPELSDLQIAAQAKKQETIKAVYTESYARAVSLDPLDIDDAIIDVFDDSDLNGITLDDIRDFANTMDADTREEIQKNRVKHKEDGKAEFDKVWNNPEARAAKFEEMFSSWEHN